MGEKKRDNSGNYENSSVHLVKWFSELTNKDVSIAGGKGASLAEMYNNKLPVPPGFVITAQAYQYFIEKSGLVNEIKEILSNLDIDDTDALNEATENIRQKIKDARMPKELSDAIIKLLNDASLRRKFGKSGKRRVLKLFSKKITIKAILNIYNSILEHPKES